MLGNGSSGPPHMRGTAHMMIGCSHMQGTAHMMRGTAHMTIGVVTCKALHT